MMSNTEDLPGEQSINSLSKALLFITLVLQISSYAVPFVFIWSGEIAWYMWISINSVSLCIGLAGIITRTNCIPPNQELSSLWGKEITPLFWFCTFLSGFGVLLFVSLVLTFSIAPSLPGTHNFEFFERFFYIICLMFMIAPPLTCFSVGASFFFKKAQEIRGNLPITTRGGGYSGFEVELNTN